MVKQKMRLLCRMFNYSRFLYLKGFLLIPKIIKYTIRIVFACDLPYTADISNTVDFPHNGLGVVIHSNAKIGEGTLIYQNVTIGGNGKDELFNGSPVIGKNVFIGAGACILGPVTIGDNSRIGANAVVLKSIPENSVAVGVPARIINKLNTNK